MNRLLNAVTLLHEPVMQYPFLLRRGKLCLSLHSLHMHLFIRGNSWHTYKNWKCLCLHLLICANCYMFGFAHMCKFVSTCIRISFCQLVNHNARFKNKYILQYELISLELYCWLLLQCTCFCLKHLVIFWEFVTSNHSISVCCFSSTQRLDDIVVREPWPLQ